MLLRRQCFLLSYATLLGQNFDKRHNWKSETGQQKWWQMTQRWDKTASTTEKKCKYNSKMLTATWLAPQHVKRQVLEFRQETYVTPLRGPQLFKTCPQVELKIFHECKAQAGDFFMFSTAKAKVYLSVGTVEVWTSGLALCRLVLNQ